MKKYFSVLHACPLFAGIRQEDLAVMLQCLGAAERCYGRRESIFQEGDPARFIGVVLFGEAQIVQVDYLGNRSIVAAIGPGELFGETFACAGTGSLPVQVVAGEDTGVLLLDCQRIITSCSNACHFHQQMIYNLMQVMARKNLMFHEKLQITSRRSTREKLMAYLLLQAKKQGKSSFTIPFDRQELADYLSVERSGLSAEIGKLQKEGVLVSERSQFTLLGIKENGEDAE